MGYYVQGPINGKARFIVNNYNGIILPGPPKSLSEIDNNQALICVVDNGMFDAAGFIYDDRELKAFTLPDDLRHKIWLVMDRQKAIELTGFRE